MQLTAFTDYGLRTLMYLETQKDNLCTVREIADNYGISRNHMVKIVHRLAQLGYVESIKGKGGGIKLACCADTLRLGDLVGKLESGMRMVECFNPQTNTCKIVSACQLKHYLKDASESFIAELNKHTLADAVGNKKLFRASLNISASL